MDRKNICTTEGRKLFLRDRHRWEPIFLFRKLIFLTNTMSGSEGWNTGAPSGVFFAKQGNVKRTRTLQNEKKALPKNKTGKICQKSDTFFVSGCLSIVNPYSICYT